MGNKKEKVRYGSPYQDAYKKTKRTGDRLALLFASEFKKQIKNEKPEVKERLFAWLKENEPSYPYRFWVDRVDNGVSNDFLLKIVNQSFSMEKFVGFLKKYDVFVQKLENKEKEYQDLNSSIENLEEKETGREISVGDLPEEMMVDFLTTLGFVSVRKELTPTYRRNLFDYDPALDNFLNHNSQFQKLENKNAQDFLEWFVKSSCYKNVFIYPNEGLMLSLQSRFDDASKRMVSSLDIKTGFVLNGISNWLSPNAFSGGSSSFESSPKMKEISKKSYSLNFGTRNAWRTKSVVESEILKAGWGGGVSSIVTLLGMKTEGVDNFYIDLLDHFFYIPEASGSTESMGEQEDILKWLKQIYNLKKDSKLGYCIYTEGQKELELNWATHKNQIIKNIEAFKASSDFKKLVDEFTDFLWEKVKKEVSGLRDYPVYQAQIVYFMIDRALRESDEKNKINEMKGMEGKSSETNRFEIIKSAANRKLCDKILTWSGIDVSKREKDGGKSYRFSHFGNKNISIKEYPLKKLNLHSEMDLSANVKEKIYDMWLIETTNYRYFEHFEKYIREFCHVMGDVTKCDEDVFCQLYDRIENFETKNKSFRELIDSEFGYTEDELYNASAKRVGREMYFTFKEYLSEKLDCNASIAQIIIVRLLDKGFLRKNMEVLLSLLETWKEEDQEGFLSQMNNVDASEKNLFFNLYSLAIKKDFGDDSYRIEPQQMLKILSFIGENTKIHECLGQDANKKHLSSSNLLGILMDAIIYAPHHKNKELYINKTISWFEMLKDLGQKLGQDFIGQEVRLIENETKRGYLGYMTEKEAEKNSEHRATGLLGPIKIIYPSLEDMLKDVPHVSKNNPYLEKFLILKEVFDHVDLEKKKELSTKRKI